MCNIIIIFLNRTFFPPTLDFHLTNQKECPKNPNSANKFQKMFPSTLLIRIALVFGTLE